MDAFSERAVPITIYPVFMATVAFGMYENQKKNLI